MENLIINARSKDILLFDLVSFKKLSVVYNPHDISERLGLDVDVIEIILDHFSDLGFIKRAKYMPRVDLLVSAFDFANRGGFTVQEEVLKANIEKLGLELDALAKYLSKDHLEAATRISSIGSAILSALHLMPELPGVK